MTKKEIYSVFDGGDAETALMKLAVSFPRFGRRDLEEVLTTLAAEEPEVEFEFGLRRLSPGALSLPPGTSAYALPTVVNRTADAFRTIFFIMFRTGAWDADILFQPDFMPFVRRVKAGLADAMRRGGHFGRLVSDLYETFAEMEERLAEKIRTAPEGALCAGTTA